jgi:hypothetical protein
MKLKKSSPLKLLSQSQPNFAEMIEQFWPFEEISMFSNGRPSWIQDVADGHNFERGPPKDHFSKVWLNIYYGILTDYAN